MVEHRGLCNRLRALRFRYQLCAEDRILQFASLTFDTSVEEIFGSLCSGAALILRSDAWLVGSQEFYAKCDKQSVSVVDLPTRFWQVIGEGKSASIPVCIRLMIIGGEAVEARAQGVWFKRNGYRPRVFNTYGP